MTTGVAVDMLNNVAVLTITVDEVDPMVLMTV
jgi:hypothetical protein